MYRLISEYSKKNIFNFNKTLVNTYLLLSLTLIFSSIIAFFSFLFCLPVPNFFILSILFYLLLFLTYQFSERLEGIFFIFVLTGFMGYTLGPFLGMISHPNIGNIFILSLIFTSLIFFFCSIYMLTFRRNMSFLSGILSVGLLIILISVIANTFFFVPVITLTINAMFVLFSSAAILFEISNIIYGGETNYIRATVSLYISLYNIFTSILGISLSKTKNQY